MVVEPSNKVEIRKVSLSPFFPSLISLQPSTEQEDANELNEEKKKENNGIRYLNQNTHSLQNSNNNRPNILVPYQIFLLNFNNSGVIHPLVDKVLLR